MRTMSIGATQRRPQLNTSWHWGFVDAKDNYVPTTGSRRFAGSGSNVAHAFANAGFSSRPRPCMTDLASSTQSTFRRRKKAERRSLSQKWLRIRFLLFPPHPSRPFTSDSPAARAKSARGIVSERKGRGTPRFFPGAKPPYSDRFEPVRWARRATQSHRGLRSRWVAAAPRRRNSL